MVAALYILSVMHRRVTVAISRKKGCPHSHLLTFGSPWYAAGSDLLASGGTIEESLQAVIGQIEAVFTDVPRPPDAELLHPECRDDMDLRRLREFVHWRDVPGDVVVSEYAALAFLSPGGFRHFIPAYLIWVLRHPEAPDAVVDSTIWALHARMYGHPLDAFVRSKWSMLDAAQREAVCAFLRAMVPHHSDAADALAEWRPARST